MTSQRLTFEVWKARLRSDCESNDKIHAFNKLGEETLRILYGCGTGPSVQGIADGDEGAEDKEQRNQRGDSFSPSSA